MTQAAPTFAITQLPDIERYAANRSSDFELPKNYPIHGLFLPDYCIETAEPTSDGLDYVEVHFLQDFSLTKKKLCHP